MEPTLVDGQEVTVVRADRFERFDIVVYKPPNGRPPLAGRLIGLRDETIEVRDGRVLINGIILSDVVDLTHRYTLEPIRISNDAVFVLGDNRNNSADSHVFGEVKERDLIGIIETIPE